MTTTDVMALIGWQWLGDD